MDSYDKNKVYSDVYQGNINEVTFIDINGNNVVMIFKITCTKINSKSKAALNDEVHEHSSSDEDRAEKDNEKEISWSNK